jgi:GTP pyrophosphokinase
MVKPIQKFIYLDDGTLDTDAWLEKIIKRYEPAQTDIIDKAIQLTKNSTKGLTTFYGQSCLEQGLEMSEIILDLKLDQNAVAAAILTPTIQHTNLKLETITQKTNEQVTKLLHSFQQMNVLHSLANIDASKNSTQIDRLRKAFLAMASDIRVILIKLAERTCIMRGIKNINAIERKRLAQETTDVYAPLANRMGIGQIKWELEDLSFHYINPEIYKKIAHYLAERRAEREQRIHNIVALLKEHLAAHQISANIAGRAKHIYSIYLKMQRKDLELKDIYDYSAVRILVPTLQDCYTALSIAHQLWEHVPDEFDDYITNPKPNGYRSIHTAVIDSDGKHFEIQIRTSSMHEEAEHGVAAHWIYKENKPQQTGYESKITLLRQLLAWHKDIAANENEPSQPIEKILEDRVYVFTPAGEIVDLPIGATPLDFAYTIHSELGHRCRGAKIRGHIVPLTYSLRTGDQVEIITIQQGTPSRDWLGKDSGYIRTARARAKIAQWFKHQDQNQYIEAGKNILERELPRHAISHIPIQQVAERLKFKDDQALLAALGRGSIRVASILHAADQKLSNQPASPVISTKKVVEKSRSFQVGDTQDLLTRIARCCKPIPGDEIVGYITQGRGVSIHKKDCSNISHVSSTQENRLIAVSWDNKHPGAYYADLHIRAYGREDIFKEITSLLANAKVDLITFNSSLNKTNNSIAITMTIQIQDLAQLTQVLNQIKQLPNVIDIRRVSE